MSIAARYMLSFGGVGVSNHIPTFTAGLAMLFTTCYNLTISYPGGSAATPE